MKKRSQHTYLPFSCQPGSISWVDNTDTGCACLCQRHSSDWIDTSRRGSCAHYDGRIPCSHHSWPPHSACQSPCPRRWRSTGWYPGASTGRAGLSLSQSPTPSARQEGSCLTYLQVQTFPECSCVVWCNNHKCYIIITENWSVCKIVWAKLVFVVLFCSYLLHITLQTSPAWRGHLVKTERGCRQTFQETRYVLSTFMTESFQPPPSLITWISTFPLTYLRLVNIGDKFNDVLIITLLHIIMHGQNQYTGMFFKYYHKRC